MQTRSGAATAVGRRPENEDAFLAEHPVFVVADGMGGYEAGELAAQMVVMAFRSLGARESIEVEDITLCLEEAALQVMAIPLQRDVSAGTTVAAVVVGEQAGAPYWLVANLGDSRIYRLQGGELNQVSVDHSEVQELVETGAITTAEARVSPRRHVVTRALGPQPDVEPDFWLLPAQSQDRILLCSDGLTGELEDAQIHQVLATESDPQRAAELLVNQALQAGGRDNVTVVVIDAIGAAVGDDTTGRGTLVDQAEDDDRTLPRAVPLAGRGS